MYRFYPVEAGAIYSFSLLTSFLCFQLLVQLYIFLLQVLDEVALVADHSLDSSDPAAGIIGLSHIDARDNTPVIDLKPYTPSLDRVAHPCVPDWCASWPKSLEESADFDWSGVFTF